MKHNIQILRKYVKTRRNILKLIILTSCHLQFVII